MAADEGEDEDEDGEESGVHHDGSGEIGAFVFRCRKWTWSERGPQEEERITANEVRRAFKLSGLESEVDLEIGKAEKVFSNKVEEEVVNNKRTQRQIAAIAQGRTAKGACGKRK